MISIWVEMGLVIMVAKRELVQKTADNNRVAKNLLETCFTIAPGRSRNLWHGFLEKSIILRRSANHSHKYYSSTKRLCFNFLTTFRHKTSNRPNGLITRQVFQKTGGRVTDPRVAHKNSSKETKKESAQRHRRLSTKKRTSSPQECLSIANNYKIL